MLKPGDSFERYTIEAPIGNGGMGSVYRAEDTRLGRRVALKVISDRVAGPSASARLVREARAAAALDHPNAVAIFDAGEVNGAPYIVMELVEGRTLRAVIEDRAVSLEARIAQLVDVGRALAAAHKRGLVHRDVKPENVMIRNDGMVKVLDFGIARRTSGDVDPAGPTQTPQTPAISTLTIDGLKLGTPVYMAPEQIKGDPLDGRADQFSWGVLAYEHLTGKIPWRGGDALSAMASALTEPVDRAAMDAAGVPSLVQEVVLRALAKRPEDRFASMEEAVSALAAAGRGEVSASMAVRANGGATSDTGAPAGATAAQRFSTQEVREVLSRAVEKQAEKEGKLGFEDLLAIAAEVGVDPESLREASRAQREKGASKGKDLSRREGAPNDERGLAASGGEGAAPTDPEQDAFDSEMRSPAVWLRWKKRDLKIHAAVFGIVNVAVLVMGLVLLSFTPWWIWPMVPLLWGIGFGIHAFWVLTLTEDDWTREKEQRRWWKNERRRRREERMLALQRGLPFAPPMPPPPPWMRMGPPPGGTDPRGVSQPASPPGARITGGKEGSPDRLRLSSDTASDQAAEEEAVEEERASRRGRRRRT